MSLISQNAKSRKRTKTKLDESEKDLILEESKGVEDGGEPVSEMSSKKKVKKEKEKQLEMEQEKEMKKLESFLFGSLYDPVEFGKGEKEEPQEVVEDGSAGFFLDTLGSSALTIYEDDDRLLAEGNGEVKTLQKKPVWVDDEEEMTRVNIANVSRLRKLRKEEDEKVISGPEYVSRLRAQHIKLNPGTEWARLDSRTRDHDSSDNESSDEENQVAAARGYEDVENVDDILRTNEELVVKSGAKLLPGILEYSRLVDANAEEPSKSRISSVNFHRNAQLLLVAGLDKSLKFFQVDGKRNTKVQSFFLDDCPIQKASFLPEGSQVIIAGRRKYFYCLDIVKATIDKIGPLVGREEKSLEAFEISPDSSTIAFVGNEGYILLVSSKTKELIGTLKMNGTARSLAFTHDGKQLLSSGGDGQIYHWDLRTRTCIHKAVDEGCIRGTTLCTSPNGTFFAAGSESGIVNVYKREEFLGGKRKPVKAIENLTTQVDFMKFNHDSQILAICSSRKKNSLKLVHVPTLNVFSNWPPANSNMKSPQCLDFSPGGGFCAVGNAEGKVLLYKLHHYHHA